MTQTFETFGKIKTQQNPPRKQKALLVEIRTFSLAFATTIRAFFIVCTDNIIMWLSHLIVVLRVVRYYV